MGRTITDLRESLFDAIELLKKGKIDVPQAKAVAELGQVIINSAKAETDFIDKHGGAGSGFIQDTGSDQRKIRRPVAEYSNNGHLSVKEKYKDA
ncbi:MAG: hypothetical protein KF744_09165 [Taibaiella sp.]|nr:hypothetical protein [Taibaiella sp.]